MGWKESDRVSERLEFCRLSEGGSEVLRNFVGVSKHHVRRVTSGLTVGERKARQGLRIAHASLTPLQASSGVMAIRAKSWNTGYVN